MSDYTPSVLETAEPPEGGWPRDRWFTPDPVGHPDVMYLIPDDGEPANQPLSLDTSGWSDVGMVTDDTPPAATLYAVPDLPSDSHWYATVPDLAETAASIRLVTDAATLEADDDPAGTAAFTDNVLDTLARHLDTPAAAAFHACLTPTMLDRVANLLDAIYTLPEPDPADAVVIPLARVREEALAFAQAWWGE